MIIDHKKLLTRIVVITTTIDLFKLVIFFSKFNIFSQSEPCLGKKARRALRWPQKHQHQRPSPRVIYKYNYMLVKKKGLGPYCNIRQPSLLLNGPVLSGYND